MAEGRIKSTELSAIAAAIRSKNGESTIYKPGEMAQAILDIPTGSSAVIESKNITANGTYTAPTGVDGYNPVTVNVPNSYAAGDEGKVVSNGALVAQTGRTITANGTYDTTTNNSVVVDVEGGGGGEWTSLKNYIANSGTQYIDTGYIANDNTEIECIVNLKNIPANSEVILFGSRLAKDYNSNFNRSLPFYCEASRMPNDAVPNLAYTIYLVAGYRTNEANSNLYCSGTSFAAKVYSHDIKVRVVASVSKFQIETEEGDKFTQQLTALGSINANTVSLYLFGLNTNGSAYISPAFSAYRFRIYESGTLLHEFVPWQENGVVCMRDTVTGTLFYNAGTGAFTYGTDS